MCVCVCVCETSLYRLYIEINLWNFQNEKLRRFYFRLRTNLVDLGKGSVCTGGLYGRFYNIILSNDVCMYVCMYVCICIYIYIYIWGAVSG